MNLLSKIIELSTLAKSTNNPQLNQEFQEIISDKPMEEKSEDDDELSSCYSFRFNLLNNKVITTLFVVLRYSYM